MLRARYKHTPDTIAATVRALVGSANVVCDRQAVDAGLAMLDAGGEYAWRVRGEEHMWTPEAIDKLQHEKRSES